MDVYAPLLLIILFLGILAEKNAQLVITDIYGRLEYVRYRKNIFVILIGMLLIAVAGLRYYVGADYGTYTIIYHGFVADKLTWFEPGLVILAKIADAVHSDYTAMFFLASVLTVGLTTWTLARKSNWFIISILLYIFSGMWHGSFNGVRQYLAATILFAGHQYLVDRKLLKWCLVVAIASMFHVTAMVMVFWYFVATREINWKQLLLIVAISTFGLYSYNLFFDLVGWLKQEELLSNPYPYLFTQINRLRILVQWMPVLFFLVFRPARMLRDRQANFYLNMAMLNAALMTAAMNSAYLGRIGIYTGLFNLILWPYMLKLIKHGPSRIAITIVLLACYAGYWYYEVSKTGNLATFQWIFNR